MPEQSGFDFLLYIGDGASPEVFTKVAGLMGTSFEGSEETVDISDKDVTNRWRKRQRFGFRDFKMSADGIFHDDAVDETVRANFFDTADGISNWRLVIPSFGNLEGPMIISTYSMDGPAADKVGYKFELESSDEITFTAI